MTDDYIRRDDAIIKGMEIALGGLNTPLKIKALFDEIPAAHVIEIKLGDWIKTGQSFVYPDRFIGYSCSECGYDIGKTQFNYCPNCGMKMRVKNEYTD